MSFKTLFFGDSNTVGEGLSDAPVERWASRVARAQDHVEINEGQGGRPASALADFERALAAHKSDAMIVRLVIALGGNDARDDAPDIAAQVKTNVGRMIHLAGQEKPAWKIVICSPSNINREHLQRKEIADLREKNLLAIRSALRELAGDKGCPFVDFLGVLPPTSLTADGVHPDAAGHAALAAAFLTAAPLP